MRKNDKQYEHRNILLAMPWQPEDRGGVNRVVTTLADYINKQPNLGCWLLVNDWNHTSPSHNKNGPIDTVRIRLRSPEIRQRLSLANSAAFCFETIATQIKLYRWMKNHRVECINVHFVGLWAVHFLLLRLFRKGAPRVVLSFHGSDYEMAQTTVGPLRLIWRWLIRRSDAVTAPSKALARRIETDFGLEANHVEAIHNGVDTESLLKSIANASVPKEMLDGRKWILNIGAFNHIKGQDILLDAFARISKQTPDFGLMLVGQDDEALSSIYERIEHLGIRDQVIIRREIPYEEIPSYLAGASIFVFPSRKEAFGIALIEAGLAKLPVIATRAGGIPEIISDDKLGILIPPNDVDALTPQLHSLIRDSRRQQQLGNALFNAVVNRFTWQNTCEKFLTVMAAQSPTEKASGQRKNPRASE